MNRKVILTAIASLLLVSQLFAHAMWIETNPSGKKGISQEVRVYFGEFGDKDITPTATWFSDISQFSLVLVAPDGTETILKATPKEMYYSASFTPTSEGVYSLAMHHVVKQVYNGMVLDYNSSATVQVGAANVKSARPSRNVIAVLPTVKASYVASQPISIQAFFEGRPAGQKEVEVVAPNGWSKKLYTDSLGFASFTPLWDGKYNVEYTSTEKKEGDHQSEKFSSWYYCSTMIITVGRP
ncbi:MAG: hypothetical protein EOO05_01185 [Chitinophagaceae bacterium]|nr:MAG: hypothetical protein EOO05_01185 [Chitinophagaceae bacterium]